eukprot:Gregarina_sp_Poly_1__9897@NODE_646_length_6978_cov_73_701490_g492_i0_p1_GENE_NODE_646_length_6978_cov_73_701490_g492_i0NODE_646_length_6978_cov_73_701490_g492_i0_p1_ORF_typecomplete_len683_score69_79_NODE_646_length_6978_cov_73_701490_g492_i014903538
MLHSGLGRSKTLTSEGSALSLATLDFTPRPFSLRRGSTPWLPDKGLIAKPRSVESHLLRLAIGEVSDLYVRFLGRLQLDIARRGDRSIRLYAIPRSSSLSPRGTKQCIEFNQTILLPFETDEPNYIAFRLSRKRLGVADSMLGDYELKICRDPDTGRFSSMLKSFPIFRKLGRRNSVHAADCPDESERDVIAFIEVAVEVIQAPIASTSITYALRGCSVRVPSTCSVIPNSPSRSTSNVESYFISSLWVQGFSFCAEWSGKVQCWLSLDGGLTYYVGNRNFKIESKKPLPLGGIKLIGTRDEFTLHAAGNSDLLTVDLCGGEVENETRQVLGRSLLHLPKDSNPNVAKTRRLPTPHTLFAPLMSLDASSRLVGMIRLTLISRPASTKFRLNAEASPVLYPLKPVSSEGSGGKQRSLSRRRSSSGKPNGKRVAFTPNDRQSTKSSDGLQTPRTPEVNIGAAAAYISLRQTKPFGSVNIAATSAFHQLGERQIKSRVAKFAQYKSIRFVIYSLCSLELENAPFRGKQSTDVTIRIYVGIKRKRSSTLLCNNESGTTARLVEPEYHLFPFVCERYIEFEIRGSKKGGLDINLKVYLDLLGIFPVSESIDGQIECLAAVPIFDLHYPAGKLYMCMAIRLSTLSMDDSLLESADAIPLSPDFSELLKNLPPVPSIPVLARAGSALTP